MRCIVSFLAGMSVAINLSLLLETTGEYDAAWWKVWLSLAIFVFALVSPLLAKEEP